MATYYYKLGRYVAKIATDNTVSILHKVPDGETAISKADFEKLDKTAKDNVMTKMRAIDERGFGNLDPNRGDLWKQAQNGRWRVPVLKDGTWTAESLFSQDGMDYASLGIGTDGSTKIDAPSCRHPRGSRVYQLRKLLVDELNKIAPTSDPKADESCMQVCDEDRDMLKMMKSYRDLQGKLTGKCTLASFDKDPKLKLLAAKRAMLDRQSFAYLHGECEGTNRCNPYGDACVKTTLIPCSGLLEADSLLFGDDQLAGIGREIAGKQRHGDSPAARGFAANLFQTNTLAPGAKRKGGKPSVWVNICYPVVDSATSFAPGGKLDVSSSGMTMAVKWIEANAMETAKYHTLQALDEAIKRQKRRILAVNRQMLTLQTRLSQISPSDSFGLADASYPDAIQNMELFVENTVGGIKNQLIRRNAEKRLKDSRDTLDMHMAVAPAEDRREYMRQLRKMGLAEGQGSSSRKSRSRSRSKSGKRSRSRSRSKSGRRRSNRRR